MLESIINPKNVEKGSWKMFFIGLVYSSLSILFVHFLFGSDPALSRASGMIVVTFCIMFSLPFMYFILKKEEEKDEEIEGFFRVFKVHKDAIFALMWLFIGFVVALSFFNIVLENPNLLNFQIQTFCQINSPGSVDECVKKYTVTGDVVSVTGEITGISRFLAIVENNVFVMIFTLLFSIVFGAGAIFVLIWNASVIAAAIGIFTNYTASNIHIGLLRYMIHGIPEIAAYFITALAGGILGVGILRNGIKSPKLLRIVENTIILLFIAIVILIIASLIEVYFTPLLFS